MKVEKANDTIELKVTLTKVEFDTISKENWKLDSFKHATIEQLIDEIVEVVDEDA